MKRGAFFLDRDGTINIDRVYINDPRLIELLPRAAQAVRKIQDAGFFVVVVTNQSGVNRGIIDAKVLPLVNKRVDELLLQEANASIDLYKICLHAPSENCECRKPKPKMVLDAVRELDIDLSRSVFVGDRLSDVATGKSSECKYSILLRTGKGAQEVNLAQLAPPNPAEVPDWVADDLAGAVDWALANLAVSKKDSSKV